MLIMLAGDIHIIRAAAGVDPADLSKLKICTSEICCQQWESSGCCSKYLGR